MKTKVPMVEQKIRTPHQLYAKIQKIVETRKKAGDAEITSVNAFYNRAVEKEVEALAKNGK